MVNNMKTKICTKCSILKPNTEEYFSVEPKYRKSLISCCKECKARISQEWYKNNKEHAKETRKRYNKNNPHVRRQTIKKFYAKYPYKKTAKEAKRRALKRNQTPNLTQKEKHEIEMIYKRSSKLGPGWQVDHIIPLSKGGLHHPDNLQIALKEYNLRKYNKIDFRKPLDWEVR